MLFSSGDSPRNTSAILSGEGFDEVQRGESPFLVSALFQTPLAYLSLAHLQQPGTRLRITLCGIVQRTVPDEPAGSRVWPPDTATSGIYAAGGLAGRARPFAIAGTQVADELGRRDLRGSFA